MTHRILDSRVSWIRLGISLAIAVMGNVGIWAIVVVMPEVEAEFGVDRSAVSMTYVATMIGFALGNMVLGRAVDRVGITVTLIAAALLMAVSYGLAALSPALWVLVVLQSAIGLATACSFGPLIADISQWFLRRRGIAVAIAASGNYLSGAIWPMLLNWISADGGWRGIYGLLAILSIVVIVPLALMLRRRLPEGAVAAAEAQSSARARSTGLRPVQLQLLLGVAGIGCCVGMSMPQVHIVALSVEAGFGAEAGAQMLSLMLMGGVVSRIASGLLADRLGGVRTLLIGSGLQCLALGLYLPAETLGALFAASLVFGLSQGGIVPSYAVIVREYMPAREAGARVGFVIMLTILGMALGGWLSGKIFDLTGSYTWAVMNGIAWNLMNIAIISTLLMRTRARMQAA